MITGSYRDQLKNAQPSNPRGKLKVYIVTGLVTALLACTPLERPVQAEDLPPTTWEEFDAQALPLPPLFRCWPPRSRTASARWSTA